MTVLHHDFESRSLVDLSVRGLHNYCTDKSTRVLLCSWAIDSGKVNLWQPHLEEIPAEFKDAVTDPHVQKAAFNAPFELNIWRHVLKMDIPTEQFLDILVWARHMSVTGDLEEVGEIFGIKQDEAKIKDGKRLIAKFCQPQYKGGEETLFGISEPWFADWESDPDDWALFCEYCKQDVIAERAIFGKMKNFPLPESEQAAWVLDQQINDRGLYCDLDLVRGSLAVAEHTKKELREKIQKITGVENPNSNPQILKWIQSQGYIFQAIGKPFVARALAGECQLTDTAKEVLELRKQAAKTSDSKLPRILDCVSPDNRLRHQFSFMGAARTGRWAGHDVQVQNLSRPTKEVAGKLDTAIQLLKDQDIVGLMMEFSSPMDVVSSTIRSTFRAAPGKKLLVCDLNAVEFRVLGWITKCESINAVFKAGLCPYKSFGVDLFGVPYEQITKQQRQDAKPGVLGGGYQLSGGEEMINEDGDKIFTGLMGYARQLGIELSHDLAHKSIAKFREKYSEVVDFWYAIENAALSAFRTKEAVEIGPFVIQAFGKKLLRMTLPSGRSLHYIRPAIEKDEKYGKPGITYEGRLQQKKITGRLKIYGGKWVENGDQSFSRDLLVNGMFLAEKKGLNVIGHTHDELIAEVDKDSRFALDDLRECMITPPPYATDLILGADGYETDSYYRKD